MDLKPEYKTLMNEILKFYLDNGKLYYTTEYLTSHFAIETKMFYYLINKICEASDILDLLIYESHSPNDNSIVSVNKIQTTDFLQNGGFLTYKFDIFPLKVSSTNIHIGDNYSSCNQLFNNGLNIDIPDKRPSKKIINSIPFWSLIIAIVAIFIMIYLDYN